MATQTPALRLFISHASEDVELASRIVALVTAALNLAAVQIRCTSVDGYRLPAGADTNEQLRREVHESEAFIGIVSKASVRSTYVLFELGARWGAGKALIPLLAPGVAASALGGPIAGLNALRADSSAQLHQLVEDLGRQLSIELQSAAVFDRAVQDILRIPPLKAQGNTTSEKGSSLAPISHDPVILKVKKFGTVVDEPTGASVTLLRVGTNRAVDLRVNLVGHDGELLHDVTAGHLWRFTSGNRRYRLLLTEVDFVGDFVLVDVRPEPGG
jgi:hypothetical protein